MPALRQAIKRPVLRMATTFTTLVSNFEIADQESAFRAYTGGKGLKVESDGSALRCQLPDGDLLIAEFDDESLLVKMETEMNKGSRLG